MRARLVAMTTVAGIVLVAAPAARAQRASVTKGGADRSLVVDTSALAASAHGKLVCVACHTSLDPGNVPYPAKIERVNCLRCHATAQFKHAFHPDVSAAIRANRDARVWCKDCHGTHDIASPKDPGSKFSASRLSASCGECHRKALETFRVSAHGAALAASEKGAPTCLGCHRQPITSGSAALDSVRVKTAQAQLCLTCHTDSAAAREAASPSARFIVSWTGSPHGRALQRGDARAANCVNCHGSHQVRKTRDSASLVSGSNLPSTCATCHEQNVQKFSRSAHGMAVSKGDTTAPACTTCHAEHPRQASPGTSNSVASVGPAVQACTRCHGPVSLLGKYGIASDQFKSFSDSYHGFVVRGSSVEVANCASCHDPHDVKPPNDPASGVNRANRPVTCGKCHKIASDRLFGGPVHVKTAARPRAPDNGAR
jgi:hypothetical protein